MARTRIAIAHYSQFKGATTELAPPPSEIRTAEMHGQHVAQVVSQHSHGRRAMPADYDCFALETPSGERPPATLTALMSGDPGDTT